MLPVPFYNIRPPKAPCSTDLCSGEPSFARKTLYDPKSNLQTVTDFAIRQKS